MCQCESCLCHVMNRLRHLRATLLLQLQLDSQQLREALHQRSPNIFAKTSHVHAYSLVPPTGRKHKKIKDLILVVKTCKSYRHSLRLKSVTLLQRSISETFTIGVQKHAKSTSHGSVRTCRQCHEWYASAATKMHDGCFAFLRLAESVTTNKALPCHESRKSHANHSMAVAAISLLRKQSGRDKHPTHSIAKHQNTGTTWDHREATK